jgi:hypothetical protein
MDNTALLDAFEAGEIAGIEFPPPLTRASRVGTPAATTQKKDYGD